MHYAYDSMNKLKENIDNIVSISWNVPQHSEYEYCNLLANKLGINISNVFLGMAKRINNKFNNNTAYGEFQPKYIIDKKPSLLFIHYEGIFKYTSPYLIYLY